MEERWEATGGDFVTNFPIVVQNYLALQPYSRVYGLKEEQDEIQRIYDSQAEGWYENFRKSAWDTARGGHYAYAVTNVREALNKLPNQGFSDHDTRAIKIFFLRRLARIYEHWATFGETNKPQTDKCIQAHFFQAAYMYMLGDIELGGMTEMSGRVSECYRGAGYFEQSTVFDKAFWGENFRFTSVDDIELAALEGSGELESREHSAGARIEFWQIKPPDGRYN